MTAIIRFSDKHVSVLCPRGHIIEGRWLDSTWGGSAFEAEVAAHQAGLDNRFDRLAAECRGHGCEGTRKVFVSGSPAQDAPFINPDLPKTF
jgi:hypothetical protein